MAYTKPIKWRSGALLDLPLPPYGLWLHLYSDKATYRRGVNTGVIRKKSEAMPIAELADAKGMCTAIGPHILVGVFKDNVNTLAHELTHAMGHIMDHVGLNWRFDSEPIAYLMGYMAQECHEALQKEQGR